MKHYLWILKTTHGGADMDTCLEMAKGGLDGKSAFLLVKKARQHPPLWWSHAPEVQSLFLSLCICKCLSRVSKHTCSCYCLVCQCGSSCKYNTGFATVGLLRWSSAAALSHNTALPCASCGIAYPARHLAISQHHFMLPYTTPAPPAFE